MNKEQRELLKKINNGTLTKNEYRRVDKKLYSILTKIELVKKYNPTVFKLVYILLIVSVSIISSLVAVNFAVK